ncbi:MAG: hypothetical protein OH319_04415 [Candidatus Parvarchaeota archaeon]|nr:hypothetical protein [Candidatus Jingweiarchaeum tengchongense]MCW1297920.1 hypothetical protein [Candidatus Jingweiarchaeum tengchongense]MCW1300639.1 hypothetical protein [Candidatus Jingweiarchaeum tengchongense]MCW1304642.1 hypothetical protein [Candidatus Jingweiarchaeum tengchongense]MCW1305659.1 hypothetical protein [Candidatus Jingweiarchaeum tengchongense]
MREIKEIKEIKEKIKEIELEEIKKEVKKIEEFQWKHHNLILLIISIIFAYYILKSEHIKVMIHYLGSLSYFGVLVLGVFYTYALTTIPASAIIYMLGKELNPILIAFIGAFGSVIADSLIFVYVKYGLMTEIKLLASELHLRIPKIMRNKPLTRFISKILPLIGGLIIASPLPDEIGVALIGSVEYKTRDFLIYSYCLNFIGILIVASIGKIV